MVFVVSPLTVLRQVLLLDTYHQLSVTTVYDHVRSDGNVIDNVALVENAWLIFVGINRNLDTARLDCGYGTDAVECDAIRICLCHLLTFSRSFVIVSRSRFPWISQSSVLFVTVMMWWLAMGISSTVTVLSFSRFSQICSSEPSS